MKTRTSLLKIVALIGVSTLILPQLALADASSSLNFFGANTTMPKPTALSSCFDYYKFGSVPATLSPSLSTVAQSATVAFSGSVTNQNSYTIPDVTVYAKIFHDRAHADANGPDVVDIFPVVSHVTLAPNQTLPLLNTWKVPKDADVGIYQVAAYVTSSDRFELSGLIFTDDVTGGASNFMVSGNEVGTTRFVKETAKVNGQVSAFAAYPDTLASGAQNVPVTINISNTSKNSYNGEISWSLYYWDNQLASHLLTQNTEQLSVAPGATTTASFVVNDTSHTVYYLIGQIQTPSGSKSIVGIRFVRSDVNIPRINFLTLDGTNAVVCIHSTGTAPAPNSNVTLTVSHDTWYAPFLKSIGLGAIASASYSGAIPPDIYALTVPFKLASGSYSVHATLTQNGKPVDSITIPYSCSELGTSCETSIVPILISLLVLVVLIFLAYIVVASFKKKQRTTQPTQ